ncbi:MAG: class I SAM-dependent methyltransferase, partial [Pirellulales bacterium]|nr:class I SAM-dependent methyltransferase [Pirellulales bacterium]
FAYTGGSTLAAAMAGAEVTHLDAAKNSVMRARRNADRSGLGNRTIRWITEDALKFCRREIRRERQYDAVILDPPSYGHGTRNEQWQIGRDLLPLLKVCSELTAHQPLFVLATCHTPEIGPAELAAYVADGMLDHCQTIPKSGIMRLTSVTGRSLPSGVFARWPEG